MPNPTDPRAVADDPSSIVQQMPEGGDDALKPCPFCGEAAKNFSQSQFWLRCSNPECGAEMVIRRDKDEAYSAWNRRATEADLRAEVERQAYERGWRAAIEAAASHCWSKRDLLADAEKKQVAAGLTGRDYYGRRLEAELLSRTIRALSPTPDGGQDA